MATDGALLRRIARAAAIPEHALANRDPNAVADEIGLLIRVTTQNRRADAVFASRVQNAYAIGKSHDGSRHRKQSSQVRQFG